MTCITHGSFRLSEIPVWVYSTTIATNAHATVQSTTESGRTLNSSSFITDEPGGSVTDQAATTITTSSARSISPYETSESQRGGTTDQGSFSADPGVSSSVSHSYSTCEQHWSGFTRSSTGYTSEQDGASTTSSSEETTSHTLDSYRSSTVTTTSTVAGETSTTETTTRSIVSTTTAEPSTTSTTESITETTTTTAASTITSSTYTIAASTTIDAPLSLIPVSVAHITEQAWEITCTDDSAGYASHLGTTFTKRSGTRASTSSTASLDAFTTYTATAEGFSTTLGITLTTTVTTTAEDTHVPFASVYPATATTTRGFTLLTTRTTSLTSESWETFGDIFTGRSINHPTNTTPNLELFTATLPVTYNLSPAATSTASLHVTWFANRARSRARRQPPIATSASNTDNYSDSGTYSTGATSAATTASTTSATETTVTDSITDTVTEFIASQFNTETCEVSPSTVNDSISGEVSPGFTTVEIYYTYHNAAMVTVTEEGVTHTSTSSSSTTLNAGVDGTFTSSTSETTVFGDTTLTHYATHSQVAVAISTTDSTSAEYPGTHTTLSGTHTLITETWNWTTSSRTETSTATTTESTTTDTTTTATSVSASSGFSSGSSFTQRQGRSWTFPMNVGVADAADSVQWSAHGMHPRKGFRHPLSLGSGDPLYSAMGVSPSSVYYPPAATQDDSGGAIAALLRTADSEYTNGSSVYSAQWSTDDSRLYFTSGVSSTYTTTVSTSTVTRTVTGSTTSFTASFAGATANSWFDPKSSTAATAGSTMGGMAVKSEYGAAVYFPPGVRHWTHQFGGTSSSSETTWLTAPDIAATSSEGYAMPTRTESVWSVWQWETSSVVIYALSQTGVTVRPAITLSLNPAL